MPKAASACLAGFTLRALHPRPLTRRAHSPIVTPLLDTTGAQEARRRAAGRQLVAGEALLPAWKQASQMGGFSGASPTTRNGTRGSTLADRGWQAPARERGGNGRLVPQARSPPQRAIQRRHLVLAAAGSWWARLTARTGAHYVASNHMGAQAAWLSVLSSAGAAASLSLRARVPGLACGRGARLSSARAGLTARLGSIIRPRLPAAVSASPVQPEAGQGGDGGGRESASRKEAGTGYERRPLPAPHSGRSGCSE